MAKVEKMQSRTVEIITNTMTDKIFSHIENVFLELKETRGMKAKDFSRIDLNNVMGVFRSIYWIGRASMS